jgi:hypothetical protein
MSEVPSAGWREVYEWCGVEQSNHREDWESNRIEITP